MITLVWINMIREQIKAKSPLSKDVKDFLSPIIQYGEGEERRITRAFSDKNENENDARHFRKKNICPRCSSSDIEFDVEKKSKSGKVHKVKVCNYCGHKVVYYRK